MNDADRVRLLLLSMLDYLPTPRGARLYAAAEPGPQASFYVPCFSCKASGRRRGLGHCQICLEHSQAGRRLKRPRHGCTMCLECDGRGERKRRKGDEGHDGYSGLPMSELERAVNDAQTKDLPKDVRKAYSMALESSEEDEVWWLRQRERYRAAGSYRALEYVLGCLREIAMPRYEQLIHWATSHEDPLWEWSESAQEEIDYTVRAIARVMPKPIRLPNWVAAKHRVERNVA